jgi:hypothetical protein
VVLQAFIDDSASETEGRTLFLAGYLNLAKKWVEFRRAWKRALQASPSIEYFRMAEAENLSGQFRGWDREKRDKKLNELAIAIAESKPGSIACSVGRKDFNDVYAPIAPYPLRSPYFICYHSMFVTAARWLNSSGIPPMPIDFIFDDQGTVGTEAMLWYQVIKFDLHAEWQGYMGSTPIFRDDKAMLPLQAADMLAWHIRRSREARYTAENRPLLQQLLGIEHVEVEITRDVLQALATKMARVPGVSELRHKRAWASSRPILAQMLSAPPDSPRFLPNYLRDNIRKIRWIRIRAKLRGVLNKARRLRGVIRRFLFGRRHG